MAIEFFELWKSRVEFIEKRFFYRRNYIFILTKDKEDQFLKRSEYSNKVVYIGESNITSNE